MGADTPADADTSAQAAARLDTPVGAAVTAHLDATAGGVRLTLPLRAGEAGAELEVEPAHCERLFRAARYRAIRDGVLALDEPVDARLLAGRVRERHGEVACLESVAVELASAAGDVRVRIDFPRAVFAAFVVARAAHLLAAGGSPRRRLETPVAYSVHVTGYAERALPVTIPRLVPTSLAALCARACPRGEPATDWVATFATAAVLEGLDEMARQSRARKVEVAARIHARTGFDPERRCFVRVLDRLVISRACAATAWAVISTAASWGEFLAEASCDGPQAPSNAHTHLHLPGLGEGAEGAPADQLLAARVPASDARERCISIQDVTMHYETFPDPLSAALIVSLYPDGHDVALYGYGPDALLREEAGYFALGEVDT